MIEFFVPGKPVGEGNIRYNRSGHGYHREGKRLEQWRNAIGWAAKGAGCRVPVSTPVGVDLIFRLKGKPRKRSGDVDKLARAVLDALTGICYEDDSQVTMLVAIKKYEQGKEGVDVMVTQRD